jgi:predicted Rossmann fold nucleotide-binding protein DprA/Smf involved in DNA uptake
MTNQSQQTQNDLKQIHDLLEQFKTVSDKQQKLMSERRNHLSNNFEEAEQQEFINHL